MGPEVAAALTLVITAASTGVAVAAAQQQNKTAKRSAIAANAGAAAKQAQLDRQAEVETLKRKNEAEAIRGRLKVATASANVGLGGSFDALQRQVDIDLALNNQIIGDNLKANKAAVRSGLDADLASLEGHTQNPILAGFSGGLQGVSTGLQIGGAAKDIYGN